MGAGRGERVRSVSAAELAEHSSRESAWVRIGESVYDVSRWLEDHPGGQTVLLNHAGRDATHAFRSFHAPHVAGKYLAPLRVGAAAWENDCAADAEYRELRAQLEAEGLFRPTVRFYATQVRPATAARDLGVFACCLRQGAHAPRQALWLCALFALVLRLTVADSAALRTLAGGFALGLFWQQAAFVGHDAGHAGITGRRGVDQAIGLVCGNALTGIEIGWWQATHNIHHTTPNSVEHDADVQHLPFMAVSEAFLDGVWSRFHNDRMVCGPAQRRMLAWQRACLHSAHRLRVLTSMPPADVYFFPILTVARYGLLLQGIKTVGWEWGKRNTGFGSPNARWTRVVEAAALAVFYVYAGMLLARLPSAAERLLFTYASGCTFAILHLQINLSHWSQRVLPGAPPGGWVDTQLAATLDWSCPPWLDWFHGGLQFQIEHHLFPRLPRANLRRVAPRVQALCARHGVAYRRLGFLEATAEIWATLRRVAHAAAAMERAKNA
jgi:delta8-fatty-acid desaturase